MQRPDLIVGLDFETYWDQDYTLKKLSTSEYIRDDRFEAQCCAIQTNKQRKPRIYYGDEIREVLQGYDWSTTALLAHNAAFDGLILSHHYGHIPSYYLDTMSMARALFDHSIGAGLAEVSRHYGREGKLDDGRALDDVRGIRLAEQSEEQRLELGKYCAVDVEEMWWLFTKWIKTYPVDELDLINLSINAFANPVLRVDKGRVLNEIERLEEERYAVFDRVAGAINLDRAKERIRRAKKFRDQYEALPTDKDKRAYLFTNAVRNKRDFTEALKQQGVEVADGQSFAKTDLWFASLGEHENSRVRSLANAKLAANSSIGITRARRLLQRVERRGWRLPIMLNYCKAHTFRWSGGDKLNPQNFPARGRNGAELRRSILAPRGYKAVVVDSSQIEARTNAWFWGHDELLALFRDSDRGLTKDPYCHQADKTYGREITKDDEEERFVGKVQILGLGYQMGGPKFQYTLESGSMGPPVKISLDDAYKAVEVYRESNQPIVQGWYKLEEILELMYSGGWTEHKCVTFEPGEIWMPNGLALLYPDMEYDPYEKYTYRNGRNRTNLYGGKLNENIIQSLSRIAVGQQMLRIAERYRVAMMSHDEVVYLAPINEAEEALEWGIEQMRWAPNWCPDLPFNAEGKIADYYSK